MHAVQVLQEINLTMPKQAPSAFVWLFLVQPQDFIASIECVQPFSGQEVESKIAFDIVEKNYYVIKKP